MGDHDRGDVCMYVEQIIICNDKQDPGFRVISCNPFQAVNLGLNPTSLSPINCTHEKGSIILLIYKTTLACRRPHNP
nr:hypothetical protein Itr_chr12CG03230 [Ipomoea trifida]